jgi:hypothetical protein
LRIAPDAVGEQQPAGVGQDRAAAIADLDELPRVLGLHQQRAFGVPPVEPLGLEQEQVLAVLPADHRELAADLLREQRHALVAPGLALDRLEQEALEVDRAHQLRADRAAR